MPDNQVRPPVHRLTDEDARQLLAKGLVPLCHAKGPSRVGLEIGCDEKTVRRARDMDSTLGLACFINLLAYDSMAVAPLLAEVGFKLQPIDAHRRDWLGLAAKAQSFALKVIEYERTDGRIDHREDADLMREARELAAEATVG